MSQTKIRVINSMGEEVAHNGMELGDIIVKGHGTLQHATNHSSMEDGWIYTGDKGIIDEQGNIQVKEPYKDIPNDQGTISTVKLEQLLSQHQQINEAAVVPIPHQSLGEIAHAFVVLQPNQCLTAQEVMDYCRNNIEEAYCPHSVSFVEELPKTSSGKILKVELQKWI
ncbi:MULTISPECIES: AMP-binding enzyme [Virgibacillus]|uniref:Long-chain-fatty-acid--CoA ligase n=2 Tax=Virgibacillus TaxID=84406 RepID=A0A024QDH9_9BACI|nr:MULTISPECIES: hypothetical protein [Virgibacillus]EQB36619.1 hypothetical protein M948_16435 [Virgibacillus sp. CM-4]MYL42451.1 hypothetical protein [Virgibacillus massiliensis]GGJ42364.1 hypothetical protein GCM10007111_00660 [Virgibacillus kapii]CDQ40317.1 Long-chain-fatty-acid--CoA ligase [Virgibacillus massiliensis]